MSETHCFQDFHHDKRLEIICGVGGAGKTTFFMQQIKSHPAWVKYIYDHQDGEIANKLKVPSVDNMDDLLEKTSKGGYVVFDYRKMFEGQKEKGFDFFCEWVFASSGAVGGTKLLATDELQKLGCDPYNVPPGLKKIFDEGRRRKLDAIAICHGINGLHNSVRNEATKIYTFTQTDKAAVQYFVDNGIDAEKIRNLPRFHWICRANSGEVTEGRSTLRAKS